jgi:Ca2+-dependent lipid-binding protein
MSFFVAGCVTGAAVMKYFGSIQDDEDTGEIKSSQKRSSSSSRSTKLNQSKNDYNAFGDISDASHVNFLSDLVSRIWPYLGKAGEKIIKETIEPTFKETLPGPLSTLKFTKLSLGDVPLVVDNILVRELRQIDDAGDAFGKNKDYLQFEWDVTWQSDCDIKLSTDKIKGIAAISFGVKMITLSGRLQVIARPLSPVAPCMDAIQVAFINPPKIELDFTGLANLADFKLSFGGVGLDVKKLVMGVVDDIMAQTVVLPTRIVSPLVDNLDYRDVFQPVYKGLARVRLHSGRGFETRKKTFGREDVPDVYVKMRLGVEEYFQSSVCDDSNNPVWDPDEEFRDFMFCVARDQILEIQCWESNGGALEFDDKWGVAYMTLDQVLLEKDKYGLFEVELMEEATGKGKNDTPTGRFIKISVEKLPFTTKDVTSLDVENLGESEAELKSMSLFRLNKHQRIEDNRVVGLATILISHANNLPLPKAEDANTYVKLYTGTGSGKKEIGVSPPVPGTLSPQYMTPVNLPLTVAFLREWYKSPSNQCFTFEFYHQDLVKTKAKPEFLGDVAVDYEDIKSGDYCSLREERTIGKYPKAKFAFSIAFFGVDPMMNKKHFRDSVRGSGHLVAPASSDSVEVAEEGVEVAEAEKLRVRLVKGYGFKTQSKSRLLRKSDVPDIYCMIKFGASPNTWRTPTIKDSENPEWEEDVFRDYTMESMNEVITIDVWDSNRKSEDDFYGTARTSVGKVLMNNGIMDIEVKPDQKGTKGSLLKKKTVKKTGMILTVECQKL